MVEDRVHAVTGKAVNLGYEVLLLVSDRDGAEVRYVRRGSRRTGAVHLQSREAAKLQEGPTRHRRQRREPLLPQPFELGCRKRRPQGHVGHDGKRLLEAARRHADVA